MFTVNPPAPLVDAAVIDRLRTVSPSTIGHLRDEGFATNLQPVIRPAQLVGTAFTVRLTTVDSAALHYAVDMLAPGYVLVVEFAADSDRACLGGGVSLTANQHGVAGIVVDGRVTDYQELANLGVSVYARGISPVTTRILGTEGEINVPVTIDGVTVNPGDVVLADDDGIVFFSPQDAPDLAEQALQGQEWESTVLAPHILGGGRISDLSGATAKVEQNLL